MSSLKLLAVDAAKSDGVWVCAEFLDPTPLDGPLPDRMCFRVARFNSPKYRARQNELHELHGAELRKGGEAFAKAATEIQDRLIAECLLVDWVNVDDGPYSAELAFTIISDPQYDKVRQFVVTVATSTEAYRARHEADVLGN